MIQWGKQDVMFAGGCEELDWTLSVLFDAMGAMSTHFNATPARASRAYDKDRDGFVIAGGAGVVVLEELERANLDDSLLPVCRWRQGCRRSSLSRPTNGSGSRRGQRFYWQRAGANCQRNGRRRVHRVGVCR
jgi:hypothetical protein